MSNEPGYRSMGWRESGELGVRSTDRAALAFEPGEGPLVDDNLQLVESFFSELSSQLKLRAGLEEV